MPRNDKRISDDAAGELIKDFAAQLSMMEQYLDLKRQQRDWHGVADAAMDIRELEAKLAVLRGLTAAGEGFAQEGLSVV